MAITSFENHQPHIADSAYIASSSLVLGQVTLGEDSSVWPTSVIRGDVNHIHIGARTNIQDGTVIHVAHDGPYQPGGFPSLIGDEVTVGHRAVIHACQIGHRCLIGMNAVILDGAEIADQVIVGACSLVPPGKKLESGYLWLGQPVKKVRRLSQEELAFLQYSAQHYVKLKNRHLASEAI